MHTFRTKNSELQNYVRAMRRHNRTNSFTYAYKPNTDTNTHELVSDARHSLIDIKTLTLGLRRKSLRAQATYIIALRNKKHAGRV